MISILVVDDNESAREFAASALEAAGHSVQAVDSAAGAARLRRGPVDALVVEVLLEHKDGLEIIRELRARDADCAIVAMCGGGRFVTARDALQLAILIGADATLLKPFAEADLLKALNQALASGNDRARRA
jgi:CheY-like chemotaxis protein